MKEKIFVTKPFLPDKAEFEKYIDRIWDADWLTNQGPLHQEFSQKLKKELNAPYITLTTNGHLALEIALQGLGIKGEVITTPFTFASSTHSLSRCSIKPVFCDINRENLTIDADKIEKLITKDTTAILAVHTYGHLCDIKKIDAIAKKHNLKIIYDAAHAFGVKKDGIASGLYGDVSIHSFHATKLFHSIEGGVLVYKDKKYQKVFDALKNFGIENEECVDFVGGNAKMNEFQAAMGLANLPHLQEILEERKKITYRYHEKLTNIEGINLFQPYEEEGVTHNFSYVPVVINEQLTGGVTRDVIYDTLKKDDIYLRKYFYPLTCDFECYQELYGEANVPVAREVASRILCLPIFNGLKMETVDFICERIIKCVENK